MTKVTDGKRSIEVYKSRDHRRVDIEVCNNGYQATEVSMDLEMLRWLHAAIGEYLEKQQETAK